jgi:hypothetical protein
MNKTQTRILIIVVLLAIAAYLYITNSSGTLRSDFSNFAIEDTSAVSKIFLSDKNSNNILLERTPNGWIVNKNNEAKQDGVNNLLEVIKRVSVKAPVPKSAMENVIKSMIGSSVKVEVYTNTNKPSKVYFVGGANQDHSGTYMLLENSSVPFLMHMEGFRGYLTPRFFTNINDWRSTKLFNYSINQISSLKLNHVKSPEQDFEIKINNNKLEFLSNEKNITETIDTIKVFQYLSMFKNLHFEGFEETKIPQFIDSVKASQPMEIYTITDIDGNTKILKTFLKPVRELKDSPIFDNTEKPPFDTDRFYGLINDSEFVVCQYFTFDPINKTVSHFLKETTNDRK